MLDSNHVNNTSYKKIHFQGLKITKNVIKSLIIELTSITCNK